MVLGDRLYAVTVQRVFDKLRTREKLLMVLMLLWEVLTMSFSKVSADTAADPTAFAFSLRTRPRALTLT